MKIDKEKLLSKVNDITVETKKITTDLTNKTKTTVLDTKEKIVTKLENFDSKQLIT